MKNLAMIMVFAIFGLAASAQESVNGDANRKAIQISGSQAPAPHMIDVDEPEAYYTISTATLTIELDPVEYSEFTIILSTAYANVDYVATSATVNIPVGALDDVIEIYIESDDCGCYYGVLDQSQH